MRIQSYTRQLIIQDLIALESVEGDMDISEFIRKVFPKANDMPTTDHRFGMKSAIDDIRQHMDNNTDWTYEYLFFQYLKLLEVHDADFRYFLEQYVHPTIRRFRYNPNTRERTPFGNEICVDAINKYLTGDGFELRRSGSVANMPLYTVESLNPGVRGEIKNIIFASKYKPDIVFRSALNNDIELVGNRRDCLLYNQLIPPSGITWRRLQEWYEKNVAASQVKQSLEERLAQSLGSVIEKNFFNTYLSLLSLYDGDIPALLPQVWLYYDPKLEIERIRKIFEHQRMDFLMIISESQRVVIELDGVQHYGVKIQIGGRMYPDYIASPDKYAGMVAAQRELSLAGYDVYRFGGKELNDENTASVVVKRFFLELFSKYSISLNPKTNRNVQTYVM